LTDLNQITHPLARHVGLKLDALNARLIFDPAKCRPRNGLAINLKNWDYLVPCRNHVSYIGHIHKHGLADPVLPCSINPLHRKLGYTTSRIELNAPDAIETHGLSPCLEQSLANLMEPLPDALKVPRLMLRVVNRSTLCRMLRRLSSVSTYCQKRI